jgi:hypothetical protein
VYQIKGWQEHFENHESRKVKGVRWVALPNKHDGKSFRRIAQLRDVLPELPGTPGCLAAFSAWVLILQVASKMPTRGVLADEDGPLDASDLAAMTGFPEEIFSYAFKVLTDAKIGWLEEVSEVQKTEESPAISRNLPELPVMPGKTAVEGNRMERNGREGNGRERARAQPSAPPPTREVEAVKVYRAETGMDPPIHDLTRIEREVVDVELWRRTVRRLVSNKTPGKNVGTMLDVYHEQAAKTGDRTADVRLV